MGIEESKKERITRLEKWRFFLIGKIPNWDRMYSLNHSKMVKTSYFWFVFVPITAKVLTWLNEFSKFDEILGVSWKGLEVPLPFSWQCFFYGATLIALGNFVYEMCCPGIVKKYRTFSDFDEGGRGNYQLIELFAESALHLLKTKDGKKELKQNLETFTKQFCAHGQQVAGSDLKPNIPLISQLTNLKIESEKMPGAFWYVKNLAGDLHMKWLCLSLFFYMSGFCFTAFVVFESFTYVWKLTTIF